MPLPSLACLTFFGYLTVREQRALLIPPRGGFPTPRVAAPLRVPDMRPRLCKTTEREVPRA